MKRISQQSKKIEFSLRENGIYETTILSTL